MPNIGALLKVEIVRLARREITAQSRATKKASSKNRSGIAELKREVEALKRQVAQLQRQRSDRQPASSTSSPPTKMRFVAKGLKSHRSRLGLSADAFGKLVGVSGQSVYSWEQGKSVPRPKQLVVIAGLRGIGKREAHERLLQRGSQAAKRVRQIRK